MKIISKNCRTVILSIGLVFIFISLFYSNIFALNELFDVYDNPEALAMGNAFSSEAVGYQALFYNPAGLARAPSKSWDIELLPFELISDVNTLGLIAKEESFGMVSLFTEMLNGTTYQYARTNFLPAFTHRNFGMALLVDYQIAADPLTSTTFDSNSGTDVALVSGWGANLAGNILKIGVTGKVIERARIFGTIPQSALTSVSTLESYMMEGIGFGADIGFLATLPYKYNPSLALVWRDALNTYFSAVHWFFSASSNPLPPPAINQSVDVAFSIRPKISHRFQTILIAEYKHLELGSLYWIKHTHVGLKIEANKIFFLWAGLNQFLPTFGLGWRTKRGDLEVGMYGEDIGSGQTIKPSTRAFLRYTVKLGGK